MDVHQRRSRAIGYVDSVSSTGARQVSRQHAIRFRCRSCRHTVTVSGETSRPGLRVPPSVEGKIVSFYALGWEIEKIRAYLAATATPVSRRSIARVLASVGDPLVLKILHTDNRASTKRRRRHRSGPDIEEAAFASFAWQIGFVGDLARLAQGQGEVLEPGADPQLHVTRWPVLVFQWRFSIFRGNTLNWIHEYLTGLGGGAVYAVRSRRELDRAFPTDARFGLHEVVGDEGVTTSLDSIRLMPVPRLIRESVVGALRLLDARPRGVTTSWRSRRGFLTLYNVDDDDLYDIEPREQWCTVCSLRVGGPPARCPEDATHPLVAYESRLTGP
jgi:hypothetical protein